MVRNVVQLPFKTSGRYWPGLEEEFVMDPEQEGSAYCHMPVGAEVLVTFEECGFRSRFVVPPAPTYEL